MVRDLGLLWLEVSFEDSRDEIALMSVTRRQRRWIDGVLQLIKEQMWRAPWLQATRREVVFRGRTERDVRRKVVRYWSEHQQALGMNLHQFMRRCQMTEDGEIVFAL